MPQKRSLTDTNQRMKTRWPEFGEPRSKGYPAKTADEEREGRRERENKIKMKSKRKIELLIQGEIELVIPTTIERRRKAEGIIENWIRMHFGTKEADMDIATDGSMGPETAKPQGSNSSVNECGTRSIDRTSIGMHGKRFGNVMSTILGRVGRSGSASLVLPTLKIGGKE